MTALTSRMMGRGPTGSSRLVRPDRKRVVEARRPRGEDRRPDGLGHAGEQAALPRRHPAPRDHHLRDRLGQVPEQQEVGVASGRDPAQVGVPAVIGGGVERGHPVDVGRRQTGVETQAHERIHEAVLGDEGRGAAVRGQHQPRRRGELAKEPSSSFRSRRSEDCRSISAQAVARAIERFLAGDGLVIRREPGRGERRRPSARLAPAVCPSMRLPTSGAGARRSSSARRPAQTSGHRVTSPMPIVEGWRSIRRRAASGNSRRSSTPRDCECGRTIQ